MTVKTHPKAKMPHLNHGDNPLMAERNKREMNEAVIRH
jgi:hypothetical protein